MRLTRYPSAIDYGIRWTFSAIALICGHARSLQCVLSKINTTKDYKGGATIYIRAVKIERDGEQYGTYYQAVRSYRERGKVKQEVIHLGEHSTAESALESWPQEIQAFGRMGRPRKADTIQRKLNRLQELTEGR